MNKDIEELFTWRFEHAYSVHENPGILWSKVLNIDPELLIWGTLITVWWRTWMWKTVYWLNLLLELAKNNFKVTFFTLWSKKETIADSILSISWNINYLKLQKWYLEDTEFVNIGEVMESIVWEWLDFNICTSSYWNLNLLLEKIEEEVDAWSKVIIIDYIQLLFNDWKENRTQEISSKIRKLKHKAMELNIVIIVLSQLNRDVDRRPDHRPALSDFRDSWSLEEDSDIVYGLYREDYYDEFSEFKWLLNVNTLKNRFGNSYQKNSELFLNKDTWKILEIERKAENDYELNMEEYYSS